MPRRPFTLTGKSGAAIAAATAATLLTVAPAFAVPLTDVPTVLLTTTGRPADLAAANGHLFMSDGNTVQVLDTDGATEKTLTGLFGARDIIPSPAGDKVYVALSTVGAIAVIDTSALIETARYTVGDCPFFLALAGGRLFYSSDCGANTDGAIASVDAASGTDLVHLPGSYYSAPVLAGAGNVLAAGVPSVSPAAITTFAVVGSSATKLASHTIDYNVRALAVSPDGTKVATTAGPSIAQFATATMSPAGSFYTGGGFAGSIAYSHDGSLVGAAVDNTYGPDGNVVTFDVTSGTQVLNGDAHPEAAYNRPRSIPGTLAWAADDSRVYAALDDFTGDASNPDIYYLATGAGITSAPGPTRAATTTTLALVQPTEPGDAVAATATVAGHPGVPVRFVGTSPVGSSTVTATTDAAGIAVARLPAPAGGTVTADYDGDANNEPSSATAAYRTVTVATTRMFGQYKTVKGVAHFHGRKNVRLKVAVSSPVAGREVVVTLQHRSDGPWAASQTKTLTLDSRGVAYFGFARASRKAACRFVVTFAGDAYGAASSATSATFVID